MCPHSWNTWLVLWTHSLEETKHRKGRIPSICRREEMDYRSCDLCRPIVPIPIRMSLHQLLQIVLDHLVQNLHYLVNIHCSTSANLQQKKLGWKTKKNRDFGRVLIRPKPFTFSTLPNFHWLCGAYHFAFDSTRNCFLVAELTLNVKAHVHSSLLLLSGSQVSPCTHL